MELREKLAEQRHKLESQLAALQKVQAVLDDPDAKLLIAAFLEPANGTENIAAPPAAPVPAVEQKRKPKHVEYVGARKAMIMALHTGPCTIPDVVRSLVWPQRRVEGLFNDCLRAGLVACDKDRKVWTLTTKGVQYATFFLAHPHLRVYRKEYRREK